MSDTSSREGSPPSDSPQWQPDEDADECFNCHRRFSTFFRRHHCRKCGRVVCSGCSPHRITIPRQFIVNPPDLMDQPATNEPVRLCNPCVPDPQPDPGALSSAMDVLSLSPSSTGFWTSRQPPVPPHSPPQHPRRHHSTATFDQILNSPPQPPRNEDPRRLRARTMADSLETQRRPRGSSLYAQHMRDMGTSAPSASAPRRAPRPRLNEEDICPICFRALPPKGPNGEETQREAHIVDCITSRSPAARDPNAVPSEATASSSSRPTRLRILPFTATEKDCVSTSNDGSSPECSICMVEYDPGDELARLECFCKFHKECIVSWLNRKAECPVHKAASMF
jgi:hypothetical protein